MNYIYDIVLNFQKYYCDFFEWRCDDKISNIRKIPLYRVSDDIYNCFKYNDVVVDLDFMDVIRRDISNCKYKKIMCLISDGNCAMGILFNNDGRVIKRSSMLYDEEDEVCSYAMEFDVMNVSFVVNKKRKSELGLRFCRERRKFLYNYLKHINDDMMWKYLYYECFGDDSDDIDFVKKKLLGVVGDGDSDINRKLYDSVIRICEILN